MITSRFHAIVALLAFCASQSCLWAQQDWPNWRGPNGTGSTETGGYPQRWSAAKALWQVKLPGKGTSTPIVSEQRIYLTSPANRQDAVLAFDLAGQKLWETPVGPETSPKHQTLASSCNASPITDGHAIFVNFKSGNFAAVELDGTIRWKINLVEKFGRDQLFWDQGTSPVLTEKHVVMARMHGGESWVAGFDKATGELRWRQPRNYETPVENNNGYSTPLLFEQNGRKALLLWGADVLSAHDATDGTLMWSCGAFNPQATGYWPAIATPVIVDRIAIVPVGRDDRAGQARVHAIKLGGSGDVTASHRLWKREDTGVFVASPAAYKGRVYLLRHRGEVVCLDPATGKTVWTGAFPEHRTPYYSSPTIGNGILYAAREDGVVFAARITEKFELLSENPMGERIIAAPVPAVNRLFLRGDNHLFCIASE